DHQTDTANTADTATPRLTWPNACGVLPPAPDRQTPQTPRAAVFQTPRAVFAGRSPRPLLQQLRPGARGVCGVCGVNSLPPPVSPTGPATPAPPPTRWHARMATTPHRHQGATHDDPAYRSPHRRPGLRRTRCRPQHLLRLAY